MAVSKVKTLPCAETVPTVHLCAGAQQRPHATSARWRVSCHLSILLRTGSLLLEDGAEHAVEPDDVVSAFNLFFLPDSLGLRRGLPPTAVLCLPTAILSSVRA